MSSTTSHQPRRSRDPRPARTRAAILEAIQRVDLTTTDLTVSSIVAEAGIARSSFYSQFTDIGDVAVQLIREVYTRIHEVDSTHRLSGHGHDATRDSISLLIEAMGTHRQLYAAVLGASFSHEARQGILRIMADGARPAVRLANIPGLDEDTAISYLAGGVLGMLTEWILSDEPVSTSIIHEHLFTMLPAWITANAPTSDSVPEPEPELESE